MLQKLNLIFVTSVTLKIKVTTPKMNRLPPGPVGKLYTMFQFDSCKTFELSRGDGVLAQTEIDWVRV